jgi:hypothetical protein
LELSTNRSERFEKVGVLRRDRLATVPADKEATILLVVQLEGRALAVLAAYETDAVCLGHLQPLSPMSQISLAARRRLRIGRGLAIE